MSPEQKPKSMKKVFIVLIVLIVVFATLSVATELTGQLSIEQEEKMEEIRADRNNPSRGYDWITTAGNYTTESLANGFTRSVVVDDDDSHNGVPYALIQVVVHHGELSDYKLTTWLTDY